jgi:hypothetical protein
MNSAFTALDHVPLAQWPRSVTIDSMPLRHCLAVMPGWHEFRVHQAAIACLWRG